MNCKFCEYAPLVTPKTAGPIGHMMLGRLDRYSDKIYLVVLNDEGLPTSLGECIYCPKCGRKLIPGNKTSKASDLEDRVRKIETDLYAIAKTQQELWEDYVERGTKQMIAPLEKTLGCKIWDGFKKK